MNCHDQASTGTATPEAPSTAPALILVGNPNVGKSVLFSKLTGRFVIISNYPGTTVETTRGDAVLDGVTHAVLDTPGVNELAPRTEDARVTCDVLRDHPGATIVQVADAKNLRRALLLTLQIAALKRPMLLVLNMMDELEQRGSRIDTEKLGEILGIPVVPTVATDGTGVEMLKESIPDARCCTYVPEKAESGSGHHAATVPHSEAGVSPRGSGSHTDSPEASARSKSAAASYELTSQRLLQVNRIMAQTYHLAPPSQPGFAQKLGWWATHPIKGLVLLALVLYFTFWFVGLFGAGTCVDFFEHVVFGRYLSPLAIHAVDAVMPFPHQHAHETSVYSLQIPLMPKHGIELLTSSKEVLAPSYSLASGVTLTWWQQVFRFVHDFLVGEYGAITMALSYGFAIVLPIVTTFFLLFGLLEDSGYLPRLAVMVNRIFRAMGLNGKAVLPMVLGLGCDTMATMTTRILETRKERVITTLLLALAVPCSAQLGVLLAMMASVSFAAAVFWVCMMVAIAFGIGWLAARLYDGDTSDFILELPPMRRPQASNVIVKTLARLDWYLKEVIPLFVLGTAILFFLDKLNVLGKIARLGEPLVRGWLGLPAETANAFLIGFLRRDYGAVYLLDAATGAHPTMSAHQVLVAMVTITLFMPCIATLFMISRELGKKTAAIITVFVFAFAFFAGGIVNYVAGWMGL